MVHVGRDIYPWVYFIPTTGLAGCDCSLVDWDRTFPVLFTSWTYFIAHWVFECYHS